MGKAELARASSLGRPTEKQKDSAYSFFSSCSDSESKTSIVKVIRSILRENFRRHIKCELPLEKTCKDRLVPLKNRVPVSAKLGENFASPALHYVMRL